MATPATLRIVEREARVFRRLWRGSLFSGLVSPVLFLAAMGLGLGGLVDERTTGVDGLAYLDFVTPGLLAASAVQHAAGESLWPVMVGTKWVRTFHGMIATPLGPTDVFAGLVVWAALRIAMLAAIFLVVAAALGGVDSPWGVLAVPAAVLGGAAFGAPLAAFAATQDTDIVFPIIMRLGILPLFLFSGAFFPIDELPEGAEVAAMLSPLWHAVELSRAATTGHADWSALPVHVGVLSGCVAAGMWWGRRTFPRKLAP